MKAKQAYTVEMLKCSFFKSLTIRCSALTFITSLFGSVMTYASVISTLNITNMDVTHTTATTEVGINNYNIYHDSYQWAEPIYNDTSVSYYEQYGLKKKHRYTRDNRNSPYEFETTNFDHDWDVDHSKEIYSNWCWEIDIFGCTTWSVAERARSWSSLNAKTGESKLFAQTRAFNGPKLSGNNLFSTARTRMMGRAVFSEPLTTEVQMTIQTAFEGRLSKNAQLKNQVQVISKKNRIEVVDNLPWLYEDILLADFRSFNIDYRCSDWGYDRCYDVDEEGHLVPLPIYPDIDFSIDTWRFETTHSEVFTLPAGTEYIDIVTAPSAFAFATNALADISHTSWFNVSFSQPVNYVNPPTYIPNPRPIPAQSPIAMSEPNSLGIFTGVLLLMLRKKRHRGKDKHR